MHAYRVRVIVPYRYDFWKDGHKLMSICALMGSLTSSRCAEERLKRNLRERCSAHHDQRGVGVSGRGERGQRPSREAGQRHHQPVPDELARDGHDGQTAVAHQPVHDRVEERKVSWQSRGISVMYADAI